MSDNLVSVDEYLSHRKGFVKSGDVLIKASRAASSWNPEKRSMRFVMSAEVEDRDRDIVHQAGLAIDEFMKNPVGFFNHASYGRPHGLWSDLEKILNGRPKRTEGTFTVAPEGHNPEADALAADMGAGLIRACSIGFIPKTVKKRPRPETVPEDAYYWPGYEVLEAELVECSPCTIPANPAALAKMAQTGRTLAREMIEEVLDTWAKHPETGLLIPRSEFEQAHKDAGGHRTSFVITVNDKSEAEVIADALSKVAEKAGVHDDPPPAAAPPAADDAASVSLDRWGIVKSTVKTHVVAGDKEYDRDVTFTRSADGTITVTWGDVKYGDVKATPEASDPAKAHKPSLTSFLAKYFDWLFGEENARRIETEVRAAEIADAEAEAAADAERQARRASLDKRFQALEARLTEKGLV